MNKSFFLLVTASLSLWLTACGDDTTPLTPSDSGRDTSRKKDTLKTPGTEGAPCRSDGTCDPGLTCASNFCVRLPDAGGKDSGVADLQEHIDSHQPDAPGTPDLPPIVDLPPVIVDGPPVTLDGPYPKMDHWPFPLKDMLPVFVDSHPISDAQLHDGPVILTDAVVAVCDPATLGKPCAADTECGGGPNFCLQLYQGYSGVCSCGCTPDNADTPLYNEDTCPSLLNNRCVTVPWSSPKQSFCFQMCIPKLGTSDCQSGLACDPAVSGWDLDLFKVAVCATGGCATDQDCPVVGKACSVNAPTCDPGQTCQPLTPGSNSGRCTMPGTCDIPSGLCGPHTQGNAAAQVGDPCLTDFDCAGNMTCLPQTDPSTPGNPKPLVFRNGYCSVLDCWWQDSLSSSVCPTGSTCNNLYQRGICQKTCTMSVASTCRDVANDRLGDYECRGWNHISQAITASPVCDFGPLFNCQIISNAFSSCAALAPSGNATNMSCRGLDDLVKSNPADPTGFCLDDTPCSTITRSQTPDSGPLPPDGGPPSDS